MGVTQGNDAFLFDLMRNAHVLYHLREGLEPYILSKDQHSPSYRKPVNQGYSGHFIQIIESIQYQISLDSSVFTTLFDPMSGKEFTTIEEWNSFYSRLLAVECANNS